jgi:hypothetical protein
MINPSSTIMRTKARRKPDSAVVNAPILKYMNANTTKGMAVRQEKTTFRLYLMVL